MKSFHSYSFGIQLALSMFVTSAVSAADAKVDEEFLHYQDKVSVLDSGVYEWKDYVFVQVRMPSKSKNPAKMKGEAFLTASALLKEWAIEQTRDTRGEDIEMPLGASTARALDDKYANGWRFPQWRINVTGREFPHRNKDGFYSVGQSYSKAALVKAIPLEYSKQPTADEAIRVFAKFAATQYAGKDREQFAAECGMCDICTVGKMAWDAFPAPEKLSGKKAQKWLSAATKFDAVSPAAKEYRKFVGELAKYMRKSPIVDSYVAGYSVTNIVDTTNFVVSIEHAQYEKYFMAAGTLKNSATQSKSAVAAKSDLSDVDPAELCRALAECHGDKRLWNLWAEEFMNDGDYYGAIAAFRNTLALDQFNVRAMHGLSIAYDSLGYRNLAVGTALVMRSLATNPQDVADADSILLKGE